MRTLTIIAILAAGLSACATSPRDPALLAYPSAGRIDMERERQEDRAQRLQDEFNQLFPDG